MTPPLDAHFVHTPHSAPMMRVLHVTTTGKLGGAERLLIDVAASTRSRGLADLKVAILGEPQDLGRELARIGTATVGLGLNDVRDLPIAALRLARLIRSWRPHVVHTHLLHGSALGLIAARLARAPLQVMTRHYERYIWMFGSRPDRLLHVLGHRLADHIFAISDATRRVMIEDEKVDAAKISVVRNGIDVDRVRQAARSAPTRYRGAVVSIGSLEPRKGHRFLLEAVAGSSLLRGSPLLIIGEGSERTNLEALLWALGLQGRALLPGYDPNPYGSLAASLMYVQPSIEEGFGLAVLEAMSLEKPVIVTNAGGLPEVIRHRIDGLVVQSADAVALRNAMEELLSSNELRTRLGREASARVAGEFAAARTADGYVQAYQRLLS